MKLKTPLSILTFAAKRNPTIKSDPRWVAALRKTKRRIKRSKRQRSYFKKLLQSARDSDFDLKKIDDITRYVKDWGNQISDLSERAT